MRKFAHWISLSAFILMVSSTAGAAVKAAPPYTVAVSAGSGGSVTPNGKVAVTAGNQQSFAIAPNVGYHMVDVKLDGVSKGAVTSVTAPNDFTNNKNNSHKLAATFAINMYQVNVQSGSGGKASIASKSVKYGTKLSFTVTPNKGYSISSMSVGAPGTTGTPDGTSAKGVFKGTLIVTSDLNLSVSFSQATSGGGGSGNTSGFTSSLVTGKTVYLVNSDGYSIFTFSSKGTVKGSSAVTSGTPLANISASWKLLSDGTLDVFSGSKWSYTYVLVNDSGTYWDVLETDGTGAAASPARMYYGSGASAAAQSYYAATYGGSSVTSYFFGYALGAGESAAGDLTISAFTGKRFTGAIRHRVPTVRMSSITVQQHPAL